jgi:hypothetical protein
MKMWTEMLWRSISERSASASPGARQRVVGVGVGVDKEVVVDVGRNRPKPVRGSQGKCERGRERIGSVKRVQKQWAGWTDRPKAPPRRRSERRRRRRRNAAASLEPTSESILSRRVARVARKSRVAEERRDEYDFALDALRDHALDGGLGRQRGQATVGSSGG